MAYIQPNSTIEFFADLGLDAGYENTLYFASTSAKDTYFNGVQKIATATAQSYTRANRGTLKVQFPMSTMYRVGYMRFKNTSFENKWFYAFVTGVDYINNITTEVRFELDVMMTWMGEFTLGECFIERQHTLSDAIGANIADEKLDTGEYIVQMYSQTNLFNQYAIYIFQTEDAEGGVAGVFYGGIYSGLYMYYTETAEGANTHIQSMIEANKGDSIVMIQMLPPHFVQDNVAGSQNPTLDRFTIQKPYTSLNGYVPRNKKLFCYPYNFLTVYNTEGESANYMYEYFGTLPDEESVGTANFVIRGACNAQSEISCIPEAYKGASLAYAERLNMSKFPQCAWGSDAFKAYIAQTQSGLGVGLVSSALQAGAGAMIGDPVLTGRGVGKAISDVTSLLVANAVHPSMPVHSKGNQTNDLFVALKAKDFYFYRMCITKNYAMMLDSFFDMYGYAVRQHGVPNMNARPNWTYVKTRGCILHGELPSDDAKNIEKIFDDGIRFWKNHANIGNYSLNNAPA